MPFELIELPESVWKETNQPSTILIIDDDDAMVDVLSRRLKQQGFGVARADCGHDGLAMAQKTRPALVLLDLRLPDTDGFAVCQQLGDCAATCDIPVIILSGMERPDIVRRSRMAGCRYYLRKPYDPNVLLVLIRQTLIDSMGWSEV